MNATQTRNDILEAQAKYEAEEAERKAIFMQLELDAAWEASEQTRKENDSLEKRLEQYKALHGQYLTRSNGFSSIAATFRRMQSYGLSQEEAVELIFEQIKTVNQRLKEDGK